MFNDARLATCLDALARQTLPQDQMEVIVVDNGSDAPPQTLVEKYPFAKFTSEAIPGSFAARNRALEISQGEMLAFTDSDCVPEENWLASGLAALEKAEGEIVVGGRVDVFAADPKRPKTVELLDIATGFDQETSIRESGYSVTANLLATRTAFDAVGPFNQKLLSGGDGEWCQRAGEADIPTVYCPEVIVGHPARASMEELVRKRRRVIGGRHQRNSRSLFSFDFWRTAARFVFPNFGQIRRAQKRLRSRGYGPWSGVKLAGVMTLMHYIGVLEFLRVRLGGTVERR